MVQWVTSAKGRKDWQELLLICQAREYESYVQEILPEARTVMLENLPSHLEGRLVQWKALRPEDRVCLKLIDEFHTR